MKNAVFLVSKMCIYPCRKLGFEIVCLLEDVTKGILHTKCLLLIIIDKIHYILTTCKNVSTKTKEKTKRVLIISFLRDGNKNKNFEKISPKSCLDFSRIFFLVLRCKQFFVNLTDQIIQFLLIYIYITN